jgi:transcriptional regulator with XRE-family HTH domain
MLGHRIEDLRNERGRPRQKLADKLGISINAIYRWEKSERGVSEENLLMLAEVLETSSSYLMGEIDYPGTLAKFDQDLMTYSRITDAGIIQIPVVGSSVLKESQTLSLDGHFPIPKVYIEKFFKETKDVPLRIFIMKGDAMEPRYRQGDMLIYAQTYTAEAGDNAIIIYNNKALLRGFFPEYETVTLRALKETFQDVTVNPSEVYVQGIVKALLPPPKLDLGFY